MKKTIKIDFIDFWPDFIKTDNYFYNILKKYYDIEIANRPDYVFCSCFSQKHFAYQDCVKIYYTGENIIPDFNLYDYALGFHYITFEDRYLRLPHYVLYPEDVAMALKKHTFDNTYYLNKKKFCNRVVSNPFEAVERDRMYKALNDVLPVDSGGRYHNNVGGPVADKVAFEKAYRFTLAYENSSTNGYTTEKILQAFAGDTIPIYWGSPDVKKEFNPDSFINCMDFPDIPSAITRIKEVWEHEEEYLRMIKAPMVLPTSQAAECLKEDYCDAFLCNIFEQDIEKAKRRNMVYIGCDYQKKLADATRVKQVLDVVKRPMHLAHKLKAQVTSKTKRDHRGCI